MLENATIAWDYFDELIFCAHRPGALVASDFDAYLDDMLSRPELKGVVVRGSEGAPNPNQRERIHRWLEKNSRRGAVLTDSVLTRGGVTALRWFGLPIRAFPMGELDAALAFVGVQPGKLEHAHARLQRVIVAA
ncbi:MAG TPA: STAS/SEC14 domain-containing protein, partial [Polyangiales bacterium]|nr:STAS/SEC14 domain-containing protein [Polyangiales bacterium]